MKQQRVAVLGLGKIGSILLQGLLKAGLPPGSAVATVRHPERAEALANERAVPVGTDNRAAARGAT
jgi:pyrroline-5-carboxylate reductase